MSAQPSCVSPPSTRRAGRTRWWIVWTLFFSTVTNYLSRQSFSVLSPLIAAQYHLTHTQIATILSAFQLSYALTWLLGGMLLDTIGARAGLALAAAWWSVMNILTGLATSVSGFAILRFMLGVGEGFNWPGASKVVAEWFPNEERSLAVAIFDSGSSVGGAAAAILVPLAAIAFGWRWSFALSGLLGFVWIGVWLRVYHPLHKHPRVNAGEVVLIQAGHDPIALMEKVRWTQLLRQSNLWGVVIGRALTDPIWWFYIFWLPQYLSDARGFSLKRIALFAWIPFLAADIGNFTGGWISGYCIRRGLSIVRARTWVCLASCIPILAGIPAARANNVHWSLALICVALWGYAIWSTMGLTLPSDLFPQQVVGFVSGLSGLAAGLVGAGFSYLVGISVDRFSYQPAFVAAGLLPVLATAFLFLLIRPPRPA